MSEDDDAGLGELELRMQLMEQLIDQMVEQLARMELGLAQVLEAMVKLLQQRDRGGEP